jgi:hypothetical protein
MERHEILIGPVDAKWASRDSGIGLGLTVVVMSDDTERCAEVSDVLRRQMFKAVVAASVKECENVIGEVDPALIVHDVAAFGERHFGGGALRRRHLEVKAFRC